MTVIRGERWKLAVAPQYTEDAVGTVVYSDGVLYPSYITKVPGIFSSANLPDPAYEIDPIYAFGTESVRNWYIAYQGKAGLGGSISDVLLLNGQFLRFGVGACATTATAANTLGSTTMDAAASAGAGLAANGIPVALTTNFVGDDIIRVGDANAWNVEYHMVETVNAAVDLEIYEHIEYNTTTGDFDTTNAITGAAGSMIPKFSTPTEAHGPLGVAGFVVGETITQAVTGITAIVTRVETGLKWDHASGDAVVECDDIINNSEDDPASGPLVLAGSVSIQCLTAGDWATGDVVCIGLGSKYAEIRTITLAGTVMSFTEPLSYDHSAAGGLTDIGTSAPSYYTHTITETTQMSPVQIHAGYTDENDNLALMRRYLSCLVNRMSIRASEGDFVRMSWDDIQARTMKFKDYGVSSTYTPWYSANIADVTLDYPTTEPYYFDQGQLTFAGNAFARVKEFTLEVTNAVEPKYYVNNDNAAGKVPYELRPGRREYRLALVVDVDQGQNDFFLDLMARGTYSASYKGFQVVMVFTRGSNDTITITTPPSTESAGGDSMGCLLRTAPHNIMEAPLVSVPLDILCRSVQITVADTIQSYP